MVNDHNHNHNIDVDFDFDFDFDFEDKNKFIVTTSDNFNVGFTQAHFKTDLKNDLSSISYRRHNDFLNNKSRNQFELTFNNEETNNHNSIDEYEDEDDNLIYPTGWAPKLVVFGSFLVCFTLFGIMNSMGAIEAYVQTNQLSSDPVSSVSWVFSIYMFVCSFLGLLVGPLYDTFGATYLSITGTILTFIGLFTCGSATTLWQFILSFGICAGLGTGFLMFPAISVLSSWFNKTERPFYIGIAQSGGSFAGIFFPMLLRYLFSKYGFKLAMRIFSCFNLGITIIGTILCKDRLKEIRLLTSQEEDKRTFWEKLKNSVDFNSFKNWKFLSLTSALFMNEFSLLIVLTYIASYAIANGASLSESYLMITILNVAGTFGKFIPSYFAQRYGSFNMMIMMSISMTLECFIIWLPFGRYKSALYLFIVLYGFGYAATYSLTGATVSAITTKSKDFGKRYGSTYAVVSFGNLISLPISGSFIVNKSISDYNHMVAFAASTCAVASILFIISRWTVVGNKLWISI